MFCSNIPKLAKRIFQQGVNNTQRYYASAIQLPFHPHYVPPGQPSTITTTSTIRKQKKTKNFSKTIDNSSATFGNDSFNNTQQGHSQLFPIGILNHPANSTIFQLGLVPTINRLQGASFSKKEDILLSINFFGDTFNETSKRKIPFLFRISTICFVLASLTRFYHRGSSNNKNINNQRDTR
ncbi:hypothetical protein C1645_776915 [Glomus cerebriforme]|uniref:Uncharacterized protein n=1 Tax=Glomus cerebriforme TaxID=658196 RepID=A0A397SNC0_9GLOM|nr:hypothetical protein C1645_776915 [Glomus cerebriforme]